MEGGGVKIKSTRTLFIVTLTSLFLMTGCNMNNPLVLEMEAAHKLPSNSFLESNKNVAKMIGGHFPKGMKVSDALEEIHANKFTITEGNREGFRRWPDGDFKPYVAEDIKKNIQKNYTKTQVNYWAQFDYWPSPLEKREVIITIVTNGGIIVESTGVIYSRTF